MTGKENDVILKLNRIVDKLLSGNRKIDLDVGEMDGVDDKDLISLASKVVHLGEQYRGCYDFILELSSGKLYTEAPRMNAFASPFKQLHSELRHLTWQIQEIAGGDYDQRVSFSGDFADAINKMIAALRERRELMELIRENENLFRSIFSTSPDGILLCDLNHCIVRASNAAFRMLQITGETGEKTLYSDLIHREDQENYIRFLDGLLIDGKTTVFAELRIVPANGMSFWSEQNASLLLDSNSKPKGYIIIIRDISERKAAEAQLLQYTDELDESNRTKDKLFSIIAHDLKSPFNALLGFSNILAQETCKENPDAERVRKFSKLIYESAAGSYSLLVNLLDWSRLQSDRIVIKPEHLNLSDLITDNMDISRTVAIRKNIALEYTTPDDHPIISDRAMINTILRNLIGNAIKYTPQNGHITVSLARANGGYLISVQDNGVGIAGENLEKLFKPGNIQSTPGTANEKGTGLGLALCKEFVNKIGGDIWVESTYGHGATFTFSLKNLSIPKTPSHKELNGIS